MMMRKLVSGLFVPQILPEKINKTFLPKKLGFIDLLRTVCLKIDKSLFSRKIFGILPNVFKQTHYAANNWPIPIKA